MQQKKSNPPAAPLCTDHNQIYHHVVPARAFKEPYVWALKTVVLDFFLFSV